MRRYTGRRVKDKERIISYLDTGPSIPHGSVPNGIALDMGFEAYGDLGV